jgi:hypothetical protein
MKERNKEAEEFHAKVFTFQSLLLQESFTGNITLQFSKTNVLITKHSTRNPC